MPSIAAWTITLWDLFRGLFLWALAMLLIGFVLGFVCGRYARPRRARGEVKR